MGDHEKAYLLLAREGMSKEDISKLRQRCAKDNQSPLQALWEDSATLRTTSPVVPAALSDDTKTTLDPEMSGPTACPAPKINKASGYLPMAQWDRFHITKFLGKGGMGEVYQAHDPRLNRLVAIKLVGVGDSLRMARFVREARIQAGINHPNVCQVYEAGEALGRTYIAMKYIDGEDLGRAAEKMGLEEKLHIIQQVAEGLHEAHRSGLIHRDIKPGNIMVEHLRLGTPHAYLLDFGLARDQTESSMTLTGDLMGTPAYMAPEQARGEIHQLDRRTDIYSLGATLYRVISGHLPVKGSTKLEVINQVIEGEIQPLCQIMPTLPKDVETIVMKCLKKDRNSRYTSARAVGEDLARYLDGEPILARPTSLLEKILAKARKNKALVRLAVVATLLLAMTLAWGWNIRHQGIVREEITREYTSRVEQIEALSRYMHMAPLHDLTQDRQLIRDTMFEIQEDMARVGSLAAGPGHFALGRGFMALNQPQEALDHLQKSWDVGFQEARVADALSQVLGGFYRDGLLNVSLIRNQEQREKHRTEIQTRYGDPALRYARLGKMSSKTPGYSEALIAFYEGDDERAQALLAQEGTHFPWFYEPEKLSADILLEEAGAESSNDALADDLFHRACETYKKALKVGPSDPILYLALAKAKYYQMEMKFYNGGDIETHFEQGLQALDSSLVAQPQWAEALSWKAAFYTRKGEKQRNLGKEDARIWFEQAIASCELVLTKKPDDSNANGHIADAWSQLAQLDMDRGQDPRPSLEKAFAAYELVAPEDRHYAYYNSVGTAYKTGAAYIEAQGEDSSTFRNRELEAYNHAIALDPTQPAPLINKASALLVLANGADQPMPHLQEGIEALEAALKLAPKQIAAHFYLGQFSYTLAHMKYVQGMAFLDDLSRAHESFRKGADLAPNYPHFLNGLAATRLLGAQMEWEQGKDPDSQLKEALQYTNEAIKISPTFIHAIKMKGRIYVMRARYHLVQRASPLNDLEKAQAQLKQAITLDPNHAQAYAWLGETWLIRAEYECFNERSPENSLSHAEDALNLASSANPNDPETDLFRGRLFRFRAQMNEDKNPHCFYQKGFEALENALDKDYQGKEVHLELALLHYEQAERSWRSGENGEPYLSQGLETIEAFLKKHQLAEALAIRAALLMQRGRDGNQEARNSAMNDLNLALTRNNNLTLLWNHLEIDMY